MTQIQDYAVYMNGIKKAGPVQTILLTLGREECELGLETGAFDAVKDILPGESEIDGADARSTSRYTGIEGPGRTYRISLCSQGYLDGPSFSGATRRRHRSEPGTCDLDWLTNYPVHVCYVETA